MQDIAKEEQIKVNKIYDAIRTEVIVKLLKDEFANCMFNAPSEEQLAHDVEEISKLDVKTCALKSLFKAARDFQYRNLQKNSFIKPLSVNELEYTLKYIDYTTYNDRTTKTWYLPHKSDSELLQGKSFKALMAICKEKNAFVCYREVKDDGKEKDVFKVLGNEL